MRQTKVDLARTGLDEYLRAHGSDLKDSALVPTLV